MLAFVRFGHPTMNPPGESTGIVIAACQSPRQARCASCLFPVGALVFIAMVKVQMTRPPAAAAKPRLFSKFLRGTFDHYSASLEGNPAFLLRKLLLWLFEKIILSEADVRQIKSVSKRGTIIYVIRNRSRLEYLLLFFVLTARGLPPPKFAHYISMYLWQSPLETLRRVVSRVVCFIENRSYPNPYETGYVARLLDNRVATLLPARHFVGLPWRFGRSTNDSLADIIQIQQRLKKPIYLLPVEFAYGRRPDREVTSLADLLMGTKETPSPLRQILMTLRNRRDTSILVGEPMSLEEEAEEASILAPHTYQRFNEIAYTVRTRCIERINRERRVVLGPVLKSQSEMIAQVLHDPELFSFLQQLSKNDEKDFVSLRRDARKMLEEIAADYNPTIVYLVNRLLKWGFKKIYADMKIHLDQLHEVRSVAREMPVVYIPCHKSHMDYLILSYLLFQNHMSLPYIVAGVNLNFWPLGPIFRGGGAFFMRRTFRGKRLYSKVFATYVEYLVREGIPIEFFMEGTRSRTGKIILPKLGFLSILLQAVKQSGKTNLCIVPVSINYEHIFEQTFYLNEAKGEKNEGENLGTMLRHRKMMGRKQGRMYLEIAKPFTLSELLVASGGRLPPDREGAMELASRLAYRVAHEINRHAIATPFAIVAAALLAHTKKGIYKSEISDGVEKILGYLRSINAPLVGISPGWIERVLERMVKEKILSTESERDEDEDEQEDEIFFFEEEKRLALTIYKNSIVHDYQFISLVALSFLGAGEPEDRQTMFDRFRTLKALLGGELIYSDRKRQSESFDRSSFNEALEFFTGHGFAEANEPRLVLNKAGRRTSRLFAGSLLDFLDSYYILAQTLWAHKKKQLSDKEWIKRAMKKGKRLHSTGEIRRLEAVHQNLISSGLKHFRALDVCETEDFFDDKKRLTVQYRVKDFTKLTELIDAIKPFIEM